jgi:hypothetical protein
MELKNVQENEDQSSKSDTSQYILFMFFFYPGRLLNCQSSRYFYLEKKILSAQFCHGNLQTDSNGFRTIGLRCSLEITICCNPVVQSG